MNSRIPSLDGLRALSVSLVIFSHLGGFGGTFGVKVFFVISGMLITSLLVAEREKYGEISLKAFYKRRALRIFPAAYFYMAVVAVLVAFGLLKVNRNDFAWAASYLMSFHETAAARPLEHLWSLSVEEQFYFIWPAALILAGRFGKRVSLAVVFFMPVLRALIWLAGWKSALLHLLPYSVDALAIGCYFAQREHPKVKLPWLWLILGLALMEIHPESLIHGRKFFRFAQDSAVHLLIALAVIGSIQATGWWGRFLNSKLMVWLGVLSYSLYLWQEPFVFSRLSLGIKLICILATACFSYYAVERPFLKRKDRITVPQRAVAATA